MVDELEVSAVKQSEREDLARNGKASGLKLKPINSMRLTVQSFQRNLTQMRDQTKDGRLLRNIDSTN
jgi:hypothetical protein